MTDRLGKNTRSYIMSQIKGRNTKPEISLRKALFKQDYRYSLNHRFKGINCKPDIVMVSRRVCIFIDGCFWHRCKKCFRAPRTNKLYWVPKIKENIDRDRRQNSVFKKEKWKVIRIWEHEINQDVCKVVRKIIKSIGD